MKRLFGYYGWTLFVGIMVVSLWFLFTKFGGWLNPVIFPDPLQVWDSFIEKKGELFEGLISSLKLLIPAFVLALVTGISCGLFFGLHAKLRKVFMPYFHALSPIPPTLFIPYAIVLLPTFQTASAFLIFLGAFWPIFLGTIQGVLLIDKHYLDNSKSLGLKGADFILKVVFPAASPYILSGAGTSLGFSFLILAIAEMFGAESGMGYFIQYYADFSQYGNVLAGIIFNSVVILAVMLIFEKIKRRLLFWTNLKEASK